MTAAALATLLLALPALTCTSFGPERAYIIHLDSIVAPGTHPADSAMTVSFYGTVGPDGCHRLDRYELEKTPSRLDVTVWGVEREGAVCTQAIVPLADSISIPAPFTDPFTIVGHQPSGSERTATVEIR